MLPAHAAVIHTVLVHRGQPGVHEHVRNFPDAAEDFIRDFEILISRLEAHDADEFRPEPLHARDGALNLVERDGPGCFERLRPIHDRRAEAVDAQARIGQLAGREIKCLVGKIVKVGFRGARYFHRAHFNLFPAQVPGSCDLRVE
jgi:hypothetical protein